MSQQPRGLALLAVTAHGAARARTLQPRLPEATVYLPAALAAEIGDGQDLGFVPFADGARAAVGRLFGQSEGLVLFLAVGAAVRLIAPYLDDKASDPAVVCVDEGGRFVVSLLSGHVGGANALACTVAEALGAQPVVTTASERLGLPAVDMIGRRFGWSIEGRDGAPPPLTATAAAVVNGHTVGIFQDAGENDWWEGLLPVTMTRYATLEALCAAAPAAALIITDRALDPWRDRLPDHSVVYRPRVLVLGMGCRRGVPADEIAAHARATLAMAGLCERSVCLLTSADLKAQEPGLHAYAAQLGVPFRTYPTEALRAAPTTSPSATVEQLAGTPAVSEPAALLGAGPGSTLVAPKKAAARVTCAVARVADRVPAPLAPPARYVAARKQGCPEQAFLPALQGTTPGAGSLVLVGLGPGAMDLLPPLARAALDRAEVIVGYHGYLDLIVGLTEGKIMVGAELGEEVARAARAVDLALAGRHVALVSSGDAGIYGMAGLAYEVLEERGWDAGALTVAVVPGISALQAAASLLGAPLMHDFAAISLSDLLTPRMVILHRLQAAAEADFVLALYNPASRRRTELIGEARTLLLAHRPPHTPVGLVANAYRSGQRIILTTLQGMNEHPIDMLTTVIVGNRGTRLIGGRMITPRGYAVGASAVEPGAGRAGSDG